MPRQSTPDLLDSPRRLSRLRRLAERLWALYEHHESATHDLAALEQALLGAATKVSSAYEASAKGSWLARISRALERELASPEEAFGLDCVSIVQVLRTDSVLSLSLWDLPPADTEIPCLHRVVGGVEKEPRMRDL